MLQFLLTLTDESNYEKIERVYNTYHDYMMRFAVSKFQAMGRNNSVYDAEDAVQNAFMKITKYIDAIDFSRDENDIKNYCFSILNNEICNVLNENQESFEFDENFICDAEYDFIDELEIRENYDNVVAAIKSLDEKYSTTLYLIFCREQTVHQVASLMGLTAKTVYTRLARGRIMLLDSLRGR